MQMSISCPRRFRLLLDGDDCGKFSQISVSSRQKFSRKTICSLAAGSAVRNLAARCVSLPSFNSEVLFTSLGASASLFSTCALVAWMQRSEILPAETPVVLSQVAFRVLIPCYLMSKVSSVLASHNTGINITVIPLIAIAQILTGALIGKLSCLILYRGNTKKFSSKVLLKKEALVTIACAFGNTLSLPLVISSIPGTYTNLLQVFLRGMLTPQDASLAAGYLALFIVGWSPFLWTIAYQILSSSVQASAANEIQNENFVQIVTKWYKRLFNPPLIGILLGTTIGLLPTSTFLFLPSCESKTIPLVWRLFRPVYDAGAFIGSAAPAIQVTVLACSLAGVMKSRSAKLPHFWGPRKIKSLAPNSLVVLESKGNSSSQESGTSLIGTKELIVICCARWLLLPLVFSTVLSTAERMKLLTMDPVCKITLLVLSAMPSAQNLVVLAQLRPSTRPLAKELANLLLFQYVGALVPITLWLAVFMSLVA